MTIAYSVNSGSEIHGVTSSWQRQSLRQNVDGTTDYSTWLVNTWRIPTMDMAPFEALVVLRGATLTTIATNDVDNRNDGKNYTTAILESVVNGRQVGRIVESVTVTFRIEP